MVIPLMITAIISFILGVYPDLFLRLTEAVVK